MECEFCGKEINPWTEKYEVLTGDGEFIHTSCRPGWNKYCEKINNMNDKEFISWMKGETEIEI